jgi:hypothetical protein
MGFEKAPIPISIYNLYSRLVWKLTLNRSLNSRTLGLSILILSALLLLWNSGFSDVLTLFGRGSGATIFVMLPFMVISLLRLLFLIFTIYVGVRYVRNKPFSQNKLLGLLLILVGVLSFMNKFAAVLFGNITGTNPGAWLQPVLAFPWALMFVLLGLGFRNFGGDGEPVTEISR